MYIIAVLLLLVHLGIDWQIAGTTRRADQSEWLLLAMAAVPLAQATLLAAWGALSRVRSYLRIPFAVLAFAWLWRVECRCLGFTVKDSLSATHALSIATQGAIVFAVLLTIHGLKWLIRRRRAPAEAPPLQFSIGFLLCWTTAVALLLGLGKVALTKSGWTGELIKGTMFPVGAVIGAFDATIGLIVLGVLLGSKRWYWLLLRFAGASAAIAFICLKEQALLQHLFEFDWAVTTRQWLALAGFQAAYLSATLLPILLCRGLAMKHSPLPSGEGPGVRASETPLPVLG